MKVLAVKVHRSTHEIGGSCVEIAMSDGHLLLDVGWPLNALEGVSWPIPSSLELKDMPGAVPLSHAHQDHVGILPELPRPGRSAAESLQAD